MRETEFIKQELNDVTFIKHSDETFENVGQLLEDLFLVK
ncbi:hypothetical protein [Vibrio furnissii]|nr:hypothetical protein [Vibrio furnissii]